MAYYGIFGLLGLSVITLLAGIVLVPLWIVRLPVDYFSTQKPAPLPWSLHHPILRWTLLVGKNTIGMAMFIAGVVMLFVPGQGLLFLLLGLSLMNFPGKRRLERWLVTFPKVFSVLNHLRAKAGQPPLHPPLPPPQTRAP